jgi:hypothetical protein
MLVSAGRLIFNGAGVDVLDRGIGCGFSVCLIDCFGLLPSEALRWLKHTSECMH